MSHKKPPPGTQAVLRADRLAQGLYRRKAGNRLGPATIALGSRALRTNDLRNVARPYLESLAAHTRETATLEVLVDGRILILDEVLGAHLVGTTPSVGTAWAIHATSTGKVLLAHFSESDKKKFLKKPLTRFTPRTITDTRELSIKRVSAATRLPRKSSRRAMSRLDPP